MHSSGNLPAGIKRKVVAAGLIGLVFPIFLAIFFTPSSRARIVLMAIAFFFTAISWLLLRKRA